MRYAVIWVLRMWTAAKKRRSTSESSCLVGHKGLSDTEQADD